MSEILIIIGRNIRHYRSALNISQEKLAEISCLHRTYIGAVERGEKNISAKNIAEIAKALGVKPHILLINKNEE
jgi:transcriptional regulator with XRE-family HTH domain